MVRTQQGAATLKRWPEQERSEDTLNRILDAMLSLLETKAFNNISMNELADVAGVAVGTIYTRFEGRESLLPFLYESYQIELQKELGKWLDSKKLGESSLEQRVTRIVDFCVKMYRQNLGLWRAVALYAYEHADRITESDRRIQRQLIDRCETILLDRTDEIVHPDPKRAVSFALGMVMSVCKDRILFGAALRGMVRRFSDEKLGRELQRTVCLYLKGGSTTDFNLGIRGK